jgi:hypothetical protein
MDEAATATPGHIDIATSPAASHTLFPVPRMLVSIVIANLISFVTIDATFGPSWIGPNVHRARHLGNPRTAAWSPRL